MFPARAAAPRRVVGRSLLQHRTRQNLPRAAGSKQQEGMPTVEKEEEQESWGDGIKVRGRAAWGGA